MGVWGIERESVQIEKERGEFMELLRKAHKIGSISCGKRLFFNKRRVLDFGWGLKTPNFKLLGIL